MRRLITLLLVAIVSLSPLGFATMNATLTPRSGEYLDPRTNLVYYYSASTNTMVPAGTAAGPDGYFEIDLYAQGEAPSAATGYTADCQAPGFCVAVLALAANPDQVERHLQIVVHDPCAAEPWQDNKYFAGMVFPYQTQQGFPCGGGHASATLYLDGVPVAEDELDF